MSRKLWVRFFRCFEGVYREVALQRASEETRLFEKEVPHGPSVISVTFLVETPSTYISISAKTSAFSLRW